MLNKNILITGCSSGIGLASAEFCARQGAQVYATVRKQADMDKLNQLKLDNLHPLLLDITDLTGIKQIVTILEQKLGNSGLDILINNAAYGLSFVFEYASDDYICHHINTNITGTIRMIRAFIPLLKIARGRIINISSASGIIAIPLMAMYSASKFAIEGFSDALRVELSQTGVKVIVMQPGVIETSLHEKIAQNNQAIKTELGQAAWLQCRSNIIKSEEIHTRSRQYATNMQIFIQQLSKAIQSKQPKTRYTIGLPAKLMALLSLLLSDRQKDRIWKKLLGY